MQGGACSLARLGVLGSESFQDIWEKRQEGDKQVSANEAIGLLQLHECQDETTDLPFSET